MFDNNAFKNRQEFILNNNNLNKKTDIDIYVKGNQKKIALDKKLEEESIRSNILLSGNIVRQNILKSSASKMTTLNNIVDSENYIDESNKELYDKYQFNLNKGKNIINNISKDNKDIGNNSKNQFSGNNRNV